VTDDDRVTCTACQNYRASRCHQAIKAGIWRTQVAEVGRALAELPQRCPAHVPKEAKCPN